MIAFHMNKKRLNSMNTTMLIIGLLACLIVSACKNPMAHSNDIPTDKINNTRAKSSTLSTIYENINENNFNSFPNQSSQDQAITNFTSSIFNTHSSAPTSATTTNTKSAVIINQEIYSSPNWNNTLYKSLPNDLSRLNEVKKIKKYHQILSYAYGLIETGHNTDEFYKVVDKAVLSGYTCIMVSVGPALNTDGKFDPAQVSKIKKAFDYVDSKNMKLMVRTYAFMYKYNFYDQWSDGTMAVTPNAPDMFNKKHFDEFIEYNMKFIKEFDRDSILCYSPTFLLYGQSLYDADFDTPNVFNRVLGYSNNAKNFFNSIFDLTGRLPIPSNDGSYQSMRTVLWFKTRQNQLTRYTETVIANMKRITTKLVGTFAELYSGDYTHQSEASPMNQDFWLEDCTFGSQTYDMARTFCETDGNAGSAATYDAFYNTIKDRVEDSATKGAKLMGFYRRRNGYTSFDSGAYCFQIVKDIHKLEDKYSFDSITTPKVGVYFGANYAYSIFPNNRIFQLNSNYINPANSITKRIEKAWRGLGYNWEMFSDVQLATIKFSKYKIVFIPNFAYFEKSDWDNINAYPDTYFVFTGDFAMGYNDSLSGYSVITPVGQSKNFDNTSLTYSRFGTSKRITVVDMNSYLGKNLFMVSHPPSTIVNLTNINELFDCKLIAQVNNNPFIYTRKGGKHIFVSTNIFGIQGMSPSELTDALVDNILNYISK